MVKQRRHRDAGAVAREMRRGLGQAANVFGAILRRKAKVAVGVRDYNVSPSRGDGRSAISKQPALERTCHGFDLPEPGKPVSQTTAPP